MVWSPPRPKELWLERRPPWSGATLARSRAAAIAAIAAHSRPLSGLAFCVEQLLLRIGNEPLADRLLARQLPAAADRFRLFPVLPLGRLFGGFALLHLAKHAFALHFLFQDGERLVDVVVANENLQGMSFSRFDVNDDLMAFRSSPAKTDGRNLPGPWRSAAAAADPGRRVS